MVQVEGLRAFLPGSHFLAGQTPTEGLVGSKLPSRRAAAPAHGGAPASRTSPRPAGPAAPPARRAGVGPPARRRSYPHHALPPAAPRLLPLAL